MSDDKTPVQDPFILVLKKPVKLADNEYTSLTLTEPTAGDVEAASKLDNSISVSIQLIATVAKVPEIVVRRMAYTDYNAAVEYLQNFLKAGRTTGETSLPI